MLLWNIRFLTAKPLSSFPRLLSVASEVQTAASYHHEGRYRAREKHCLFKYTLEGEGAFRDAEGEHRARPGAGFLCRISDPETAYYYPTDGRRPWVFVLACFDGGNVAEQVKDMVELYGPIYHIPKREAAIQRMLACQSYASQEQPIAAGEGARLVMDLLAALAATRERVSEKDPDNELIARSLRIIRSATDRNMNASELAHDLGCSREHLSRVFKVQTGVTPYRYIMQHKVRAALHLLRESELTMKEIATRLGFEHAAHFTRVFRGHTGTTPSAYRASGAPGA